MVHLRRGDYVGLNEDLKLEYYSTAINKLEKNWVIVKSLFLPMTIP